MMIFAFICAIIGYLGVIRIQRRWYKRGVLTEGNFVLFQVPVISFLVLTGFLAFSTTLKGIVIGSALSLLCTILGIPLARRIYKQRFASKSR